MAQYGEHVQTKVTLTVSQRNKKAPNPMYASNITSFGPPGHMEQSNEYSTSQSAVTHRREHDKKHQAALGVTISVTNTLLHYDWSDSSIPHRG